MIGSDVTRVASSRNYTGVFYNTLEQNPAPPWLSRAFDIINSDVMTEIMAFVTGVPEMRKWVDERVIKQLREYSLSITKEDWELTIGISRDDIQFDKFGNIVKQIASLALAVPRHYKKFFVDLLKSGFTTICYDGADFFSAAHPNGPGEVYSNTTNVALSKAAYEAAKLAASKIKNPDTGVPLEVQFQGSDAFLFYGPNAEVAQLELFGQPLLTGGQGNVYYNAIPEANRIKLPELGNSGAWFLLDLSHPMLYPFALMVVQGLNFRSFDQPSDWIAFSKKEYVYGIDTQDAAMHFLPQLAYGSSFTT